MPIVTQEKKELYYDNGVLFLLRYEIIWSDISFWNRSSMLSQSNKACHNFSWTLFSNWVLFLNWLGFMPLRANVEQWFPCTLDLCLDPTPNRFNIHDCYIKPESFCNEKYQALCYAQIIVLQYWVSVPHISILYLHNNLTILRRLLMGKKKKNVVHESLSKCVLGESSVS